MPEDQISVGISQTQPGADGLITQANCIGSPAIYCLQPATFAIDCRLLQKDASTGYATVVWKMTGTPTNPAWTVLPSGSVVVPVTGNSVTLKPFQKTIIDPAGTLAALTIVFPASPVDGTVVSANFQQIITALTITPSAGTTLGTALTAKTAAAVGDTVTATYDAASMTWF